MPMCSDTPANNIRKILTHAESLEAALVDGAILVRLAARHTDPVRTLHARRAVRTREARGGDAHALNIGIS